MNYRIIFVIAGLISSCFAKDLKTQGTSTIVEIDTRLAELTLIWSQETAIINRLTHNKTVPVKEGTKEYFDCLNSSKRIKQAEAEAKGLKQKRATIVSVSGEDPVSIQPEKRAAVEEIKYKDSSKKPEAKFITIRASGTGQSEDGATKKALQSAVEQAIGVLTYSKTTIKNEDIAMERIDVLSNGFVKTFNKLSSKKEGDLWAVSIDAVVQNGTVADFLKTKGIESKVDLKNNWSQMTTGLNAKKQAIDLYKAKILEIKSRLFSAKLIDLKTGLVSQSITTPYIEDDLDGNATCLWAVKIEPDLEFWNACAYPLLEACFQTLCVGKETIRVRYQTANLVSRPGGRTGPGGRTALSEVLGGKTPNYLPPLLRVADPKLYYYAGEQDPGLHVSLFPYKQNGQNQGRPAQNRPYQGELVYDGQTNLYCVILERPVSPLESQVTAYFLKQEVIDRLYPINEQHRSYSHGMDNRNYLDSWTLEGLASSADGASYSWNVSDQLVGIIGAPLEPKGIPRAQGPLYYGPWIQCGGGHYDSNGVSVWPMWKDLSCYSKPGKQGWGCNVIHDGKMYPLEYQRDPPPFTQFLFLPLIFEMPIDALPKITKVSASLTVKPVTQQQE